MYDTKNLSNVLIESADLLLNESINNELKLLTESIEEYGATILAEGSGSEKIKQIGKTISTTAMKVIDKLLELIKILVAKIEEKASGRKKFILINTIDINKDIFNINAAEIISKLKNYEKVELSDEKTELKRNQEINKVQLIKTLGQCNRALLDCKKYGFSEAVPYFSSIIKDIQKILNNIDLLSEDTVNQRKQNDEYADKVYQENLKHHEELIKDMEKSRNSINKRHDALNDYIDEYYKQSGKKKPETDNDIAEEINKLKSDLKKEKKQKDKLEDIINEFKKDTNSSDEELKNKFGDFSSLVKQANEEIKKTEKAKESLFKTASELSPDKKKEILDLLKDL